MNATTLKYDGAATRLSDEAEFPLPTRPQCRQAASSKRVESGIFRAYRLGWLAHWTERSIEAELRILQSSLRLAEQQKRFAEAELEARRRLAQLSRFAEDEEAEQCIRQRLRQANLDEAQRILEGEVQASALLLEREILRHQRLTIPFGGDLTHASLPPAKSVGAMEVHISDEQIESLALQAITRLSHLPADEAQQSWSDWRQELICRLPAYAAAEVIRRAEELRNLAR